MRNHEYAKWLCPYHDDNEPSFAVWVTHYHCFGCGAHGTVIDWVMARESMSIGEAIDFLMGEQATPEAMRREAQRHRQIANQKRRQISQKQREISTLDTEVHWHEEYARALVDRADAKEYLEQRGIPEAVAMYFGLGYRSQCPPSWGGPAISIPWMVNGELRGIQYRIVDGVGPRRYRWDERAHGNVSIYNADTITDSSKPLWVVEGVFKSLVLITRGLDSVALVNKQGWKSGWAGHFQKRPIFVCLDPDAREESEQVARDIGPNAKVVDLPKKCDDLIVQWGWDADMLRGFAQRGIVRSN